MDIRALSALSFCAPVGSRLLSRSILSDLLHWGFPSPAHLCDIVCYTFVRQVWICLDVSSAVVRIDQKFSLYGVWTCPSSYSTGDYHREKECISLREEKFSRCWAKIWNRRKTLEAQLRKTCNLWMHFLSLRISIVFSCVCLYYCSFLSKDSCEEGLVATRFSPKLAVYSTSSLDLDENQRA